MKKTNYRSIALKSVALALVLMLGMSLYVLAEGGEQNRDGEKIAGGYVADPAVSVPANSYVTFSTVYNGRRYYLGVDTVAAKAPLNKDTVTWYEGPNYAAMWIVGPMWSSTGAILANKDYTRTIQSVWLDERVNRDRFLAVGSETGSYSSLILREEGAMWHTEKDSREQNRYINGYLYYYSNSSGLDVYRYLSYDPVYRFSRLQEAKPEMSQRISVWDRTTGTDLGMDISPATYTFGYEPTNTTTKLHITAQVSFYEYVDRFRSRMDQADVYVSRSTPITDQTILQGAPYNLTGHYEWKSNPINHANIATYNGKSLLPYYTITSESPVTWGWRDSTVMYMKAGNSRLIDNLWHDTVYTVGKSPVDEPSQCRFLTKPANGSAPTEGAYTNHKDWLYIHFTCNGREYRDSLYLVRQTFHNEPNTTLTLSAAPEDHVFPYTYNNQLANGSAMVTSDVEHTFTVSGRYKMGNTVLNATNTVAATSVGEVQVLNIAAKPCHRDTVWILDGNGQIVLDGGGNPTYSDIVLYDTLLVSALNLDGTPCTWVESISLPARNQIKVRVNQYFPEAIANRTAQIRFIYRYWRAGVQATDEHIILISQEWSGAHDSELYSFVHKDTEADGLQAVHERHDTFYAIPGENLSLPVHHDHWGYYRWFLYEGAGKDKDLQYNNTWTWGDGTAPTNVLGDAFMLINHTTATTSRGRWDIIKDVNTPSNPLFANDHFVRWTPTVIPEVTYPEKVATSTTKSGKVACDVSEYYDVEATGAIGSNMSALTEPTLSYRQVFDIQPAKTRADQLANVRGNGSGANWLEEHTLVAPAGREFKLQVQCPIAYLGAQEIDEEHLQYIYYANPTAAKIGTRDDLTDTDLQENRYYARVGKKKEVDHEYRLNLLTLSELKAMNDAGTKKIILLKFPTSKNVDITKNSS